MVRLGTWAGPALGIGAWVARIAPDHVASQRVAAAVGMTRRGRFDADHELWAGPVPDARTTGPDDPRSARPRPV